ncbi:hypothetical protein MKX03_022845 [Papaver bracteatum]|nr:hypothetical protein MKX03_022845 [Papaver bracteatum]
MRQQPLCPGKQEWPELVGAKPQTAKEIIEMENPLVTAVFIEQGQFRIMDFRCGRVFLWITPKAQAGPEGIVVVKVPKVG